jgi:hypothetical protein
MRCLVRRHTVLRQSEPTTPTFAQGEAQPRFQGVHLPADRRLAAVQGGLGGRITTTFDHRHKNSKQFHIDIL